MKRLLVALTLALCAAGAGAVTYDPCKSGTLTLPETQTVAFVTDADSTAVVVRLAENPGGGSQLGSWSVSAGSTQIIGPYPNPQRLSVTCAGNLVVSYEFFPFDPSAYLPLSTTGAQSITASTSLLLTSPIVSASGVVERKVTNVTVADDGAGTKPALVIPITTDFVTCTCNDATGCAATIAEPTPTSGYGRSLTIVSVGTGNCEIADSSGVVELGTTLVIEPTSAATFAYLNASWYNLSYKDNVP